MELKKTKKADMSNKSTFFFSIGLFVTLSALVAVFEIKTYDEVINLGLLRVEDNMEELLDIPLTEQMPPPPPIQQPQIIEVPEEALEEEVVLNLDVEATNETRVEQLVIKQEQEEEEDFNQIFTIVEEEASPVGGTTAFYKYVSDHLKYPSQAKRMGVAGRVFCEFVINRDGSIQDVKVIRGIGAGCDEEAVRVIQSAPAWKAAKQRGRAVRSKFHLAIIFKL